MKNWPGDDNGDVYTDMQTEDEAAIIIYGI